ncbi:MAG: 4-alpha-glucanotransferase [bacterium]|nr:4-alpha-glucanotransferase [bacterium]
MSREGGKKQRGSGVLLHIVSLPSSYGIGDLGSSAYRFADFLAESGQKYWQILPLNATGLGDFPSPYNSISSLAGNILLISPEMLADQGWLETEDLARLPVLLPGKIDYPAVMRGKIPMLRLAYERFRERNDTRDYERFCAVNSSWLEDYALFAALQEQFPGTVWNRWPRELRDREPEALKSWKEKLREAIAREKFFQYVFFQQWMKLKEYCGRKQIQIIGDLPIYVDYNSVDLWVNPEVFKLNAQKEPLAVAGVPPDYFSPTGQLWGNPVYNWEGLKSRGYSWWIKRMDQNFYLYDLVRIDHFRGFAAYWEVPPGEKTAVNGRWVQGPAEDFFQVMSKRFTELPIIAEDLGVITEDVNELRRRFGFPGMKILLFAFGGDFPNSPYAPHNFEENCVAYTGTHDNNTARGWFENEASKEEKEHLRKYLGREVSPAEVPWELIRIAMMSVAKTVIFPMQDILSLGQKARMNRPATTTGNYQWRFDSGEITPEISLRLKNLTEVCGRL